MSRLFKEKIVSGVIFKEQEESRDIYILKKGIVVIKKGEFRVGEVTQGKIFGYENALSEQDRTISAHTKEQSVCTLYQVSVFDLCQSVSIELLKNLMKQGRKKLEQYHEVCFKFHHLTDPNKNNYMKTYKINKGDKQSAVQQISNMMNPQINIKQNRSQSSHIQGRSQKYISQQNIQKSQDNPFCLTNSTLHRESQQTQKNFDKSKQIQDKSSPKSTQTAFSYLANPSYQTTHQIQTSGLIITMGAANQNLNTQQSQLGQQNSNFSNYLNLIEGEQNSQEEGLEQISSQYQSNKSDYQMQRFYSQTSKRVQTSGLNNQDQRKVLSRKMIEKREHPSNTSKVAQTDQSWFVIKRLNTPSKVKKAQSEFNSRYQSNVLSPSYNLLQTQQSKDLNSFSNLMTMVTKNNNTEEQESPTKQRATLTSYIKQKNGQNGQTIFSATKQNYFVQQSRQNSGDQMLIQQHNQMKQAIKDYIESEIQEESKKESPKEEIDLLNGPGTAIHSIGSQDDEEDRIDFNLESKYSAKKSLIQQSRYSSHQQTQSLNQNFNSTQAQNNNLPIEINEYSSVNSKNNPFYNNQHWNKYSKQLANKNSYSNQGSEKIEQQHSIFQNRPASNLSYVKPRYEIYNNQYTRYQIMNAQQKALKYPTKVNIGTTQNSQNFEDLIQLNRKSSPQLFNNTMLNRKLEKSEDALYHSQLQQKQKPQKELSSPNSQQQQIQENRRVSFGQLQNGNGLAIFKKDQIQYPDIYKVSDFIQENQFQDDQFSKSRDSERLKSKESFRKETKVQTPLIQYNSSNVKIKLRTNSCHTTGRSTQNQNQYKEIIKASS